MKIPISVHQKTHLAQLLNQLNTQVTAVRHAQEKKDLATLALLGAANMVALESGKDEGVQFEGVHLSSEKGQDYLVLQETAKPEPATPTTPNAG